MLQTKPQCYTENYGLSLVCLKKKGKKKKTHLILDGFQIIFFSTLEKNDKEFFVPK